jgi:hypothetical protein
MATKKTRLFTFRCTEKEEARLQRVARHYSMSVSAMLRMLVRNEALAIRRERQ